MQELRSIRIQGLRRLQDVTLELRPLTVLLGSNGVGKTTLLDAFTLLSASAHERLTQALSDVGGIAGLVTRNGAGFLGISVRSIAEGVPFRYDLQLRPQDSAHTISSESLTEAAPVFEPGSTPPTAERQHILAVGADVRLLSPETSTLMRPTWHWNHLETALAQTPRSFQAIEGFRNTLASVGRYGLIDVGPRSVVRLPQTLRPVTIPDPSGADLVAYLYQLREGAPERFECLTDTLAAAFPEFDRLGFPSVASGMVMLTWKDRRHSTPFFLNELSEGTIRFLWLIALLTCPHLPNVLLIDEPEVSLHPGQFALLVDAFRGASRRSRIIVATQSDALVRQLRREEVMMCELDEGQTRLTAGADLDLEGWLDEYSLSELWRMNVLSSAH